MIVLWPGYLFDLSPEMVVSVELPPASSTDWAGVRSIITASSHRYGGSFIITVSQLSAILAVWYAFEFGESSNARPFAKSVYGALTTLAVHHVSAVHISTHIDHIFMLSCFHIIPFYWNH
ncbi:MAG: hypothetical protein NTZ38_01680 [Candidatus Taylorbacteria bacterium]|nr:hypothetical protein [Candidatus Taylorbacteria bacterium]